MAFPFLPPLRDDSDVKIDITKSGEWVSTSKNTLPNLVDSLKVSGNGDSDISSIPDVWARPALVEMILNDKNHHLHHKYINEWRGLLAILAFHKMLNLPPLTLETIEIPEKTDKLTNPADRFLTVVSRSLPKRYMSEQNDTTLKAGKKAKIQLLIMGDKPLAILWPSILVCPAVELEKHRIREVPWWRPSGIANPLEYMNDDDKSMLHKWLNGIVNDENRSQSEMLSRLLKSFLEDICDSMSAPLDENIQFSSGDLYRLNITGACQCLAEPIVQSNEKNFMEKSDIIMKNERDNTGKKILLLSYDIAKQWNTNESDIIVGGYLTAGAIMPKYTRTLIDHTKVGDVDLNQFNAEIHMADEFFTDKIATIPLDSADSSPFLNCMGVRSYDYQNRNINVILPLKKRLLEFFTPEYLEKHTHLNMMRDGIEVILELPVQGKDDRERTIVARKKYVESRTNDGSSEVLEYSQVPLLSIWPNFITQDPQRWRAYYTFFSTMGMDDFMFYAEPTNADTVKRQIPQEDMSNAEITRSKSFPEAFSCSANGKEIGLLLIKKPRALNTSGMNKICKIGVDFGTTNTIAYMELNGEKPVAIELKNRMFPVITTSGDPNNPYSDEYTNKAFRTNFLSPTDQPDKKTADASIKSMFHTFPLSGGTEKTKEMLSIGNIYYVDDGKNIRDDAKMLQDVHTSDLKWDNQSGVLNLQAFLTQLCVQCLAEAVSSGATKVNWSYSYPTSFTKRKIMDYQNTWKQSVIREIQAISSVTESKPLSQTESISIAQYFREDMGASIKRGIVCLDIGGGSTDIAVWQGNTGNILYQTSLRLAGKNILNQYLWDRHERGEDLLDRFRNGNADMDKILDQLQKYDKQHDFDIGLETLLRYYERTIFDSLPDVGKMPEINRMIRDIAFVMSGLFFYTGIIIGYLQRKGTYENTDQLPHCYVGGNASKLLDWAAEGEFDDDAMIADVFRASFQAGVRLEYPDSEASPYFDVKKTNRPKQEVAYGLVAEEITGGIKDQGLQDIIAGEHFTLENGQSEDEELITSEDFLNLVQIDDKQTLVFEKFLDVFNPAIEELEYEPIRLDGHVKMDICTDVNQELVDICNKANGRADDVTVEPLFILVLKTMYRYLSRC